MSDPRIEHLENRIRQLRRRLQSIPQRSSERVHLEEQLAEALDDLDRLKGTE